MQISKINFSLLTLISLLTYLYFLWAWPKGACPGNYGRGLVSYAQNPFKSCYTKFELKLKKYANLCKLGK